MKARQRKQIQALAHRSGNYTFLKDGTFVPGWGVDLDRDFTVFVNGPHFLIQEIGNEFSFYSSNDSHVFHTFDYIKTKK